MGLRRYGVFLLIGVCSCFPSPDESPRADEATAQRLFRAVYGCTGESLDSLAAPDIRMSYPIFAERLGSDVLEGRGAVERFSAGFCQRWLNPEVTVHDVVSDSSRVVLVWSFVATPAGDDDSEKSPVGWGGISVFEVDEVGRIVAEYGEESTPGPFARLGR